MTQIPGTSAAAGIPVRLLSPERAAAYLGLGSRWAIYRLVSTGQLAAVKLAGKVRIDLADLDAFIEAQKGRASARKNGTTRPVASGVPQSLAAVPPRGVCRRSVTVPVTTNRRGP